MVVFLAGANDWNAAAGCGAMVDEEAIDCQVSLQRASDTGLNKIG